MDIDLRGQTALVLGGSKGIGEGIARKLALSGATVGITSRSAESARKAAFDLNEQTGAGQVVGIGLDVSDVNAISPALSAFHEQHGLDILVNSAGIAFTRTAEEMTEAEWDSVLDTNLKGTFFSNQAAFRLMKGRGGRIINIASALGLIVNGRLASYCASKAGMIHLTRALAFEWASEGVFVNAVAPGYVITDMNREILSKPSVQERMIRQVPAGRLGLIDDVVRAVLYLADPGNTFVTGQVLVVDGGWTIH
ncbi:MAG TPA: SDR family oxidoreductase [Symbiobacteriaceae bacterium]|nr:SDR family oxidoreductase [Symbiobacteriaceae bacterium]